MCCKNRKWVVLTDSFAVWLATQCRHATKYFADPALLVTLMPRYRLYIRHDSARALQEADANTVVTVQGAGALYGFLKVREVVDDMALLGASAVRLMAELNLGRELFLRDAPCPLVFWLPNYAVTAVARHAPDFWAWRSGVFEFALEEPQRREAYARYVELDGNLAALSSLTAARKLQRQRILEGLLDDFQALPPQRHPGAVG